MHALLTVVTNSTAAVDVILRDAKTQRLVAKGRYTEQGPHELRARASAYLHSTAEAARSAVLRLQHTAESVTNRADSSTPNNAVSAAKQAASENASDPAERGSAYTSEHHTLADAKQAASAYVSSATSAVKAAAQRLQHAAGGALQLLADKAVQQGYLEVQQAGTFCLGVLTLCMHCLDVLTLCMHLQKVLQRLPQRPIQQRPLDLQNVHALLPCRARSVCMHAAESGLQLLPAQAPEQGLTQVQIACNSHSMS